MVPPRRSWSNRKWSRIVLILLGAVLQWRPTSVPPAWWQRGWPRQRVDSVAAAELLSQLAVVLMPKVSIKELFRSFPSPEGWSGNYLEPDLVAFGVLKDPDAALFVEYDRDVDRAKRESKTKDQKNQALLEYGPPGSCVLRINHRHSSPLKDQVLEIRVCPWQPRNTSSLQSALEDTLTQTFRALGQVLSPKAAKRLGRQANRSSVRFSAKADKFVQRETASSRGNTTEEIAQFLEAQGFTQNDRMLIRGRAALSGKSIERSLQPKIDWFCDIGLSKVQAAKAIIRFPCILDYSIEETLNPKFEWLLEIGLSKDFASKALRTFPQILGLSIEHNLKPTVQFFAGIGLQKAQVVKVIATSPRILGCSIEQNLKPTVQWLLNIGLNEDQVAKVVAQFPSILACSIEQNLKPTVHWLLDIGLNRDQVARVVTTHSWTLGFGVEKNVEPARQWLLDIGLSKEQVVNVVASFPILLGLRIEENLKPKQALLERAFGRSGAVALIGKYPRVLSFSYQRLSERFRVLSGRDLETNQLSHAMFLTECDFQKRFLSK
ncbi:Transcription termination factor MTERF4 [Durusdinium trenchii]|uniref:Chloroplastic (Mitochondrial transcription termination factor 4) n=1 Tax=Durusdinium trenchii TaxID=1381693 RepID=A0ABP0H8L0_9DINO